MSSPYCTIVEIQDLLGPDAVIQASNDADSSTQPNQLKVSNAINRADARIKGFVSLRYDVDVLTSQNDWLKWCSATIAAVNLMRRRGNPLPPGLEDQYKEFLELLKAIHDGTGEIPIATLKHEPGMVMSNLRFDPRFKYAKVRAEQAISAGEQNSTKPRRSDYVDVYPDF